MPVRPPDETEVAALAAGYGMKPTAEEVAAYTPIVAAFLSSYDAVEELYADVAPQAPADRPSSRPAEADNPLGAWYVTTDIRGAADGPLAGRTVPRKSLSCKAITRSSVLLPAPLLPMTPILAPG